MVEKHSSLWASVVDEDEVVNERSAHALHAKIMKLYFLYEIRIKEYPGIR